MTSISLLLLEPMTFIRRWVQDLRQDEKKSLRTQPHRRKEPGDSVSFFGVGRLNACPSARAISARQAGRVRFGGRSRRRQHDMSKKITRDRTVIRCPKSIRYPSLVRVVRPPENCTDQGKPPGGAGKNHPWSPGPTQIRYCGSVEKLECPPRHRFNRLKISNWVGPADHPRFSPSPSPGSGWSVQKIGGRTTRTNVCEVIG